MNRATRNHSFGIGRVWGLLFSAVGLCVLLSIASEEISPQKLFQGRIIAGLAAVATLFNLAVYFGRWRHNPTSKNVWYHYFVAQLWLSIVTIMTCLWLFWTSLSEISRLLFAMCALFTIPISALGTIRPPSYGKRTLAGELLPYAPPAALIPTYLIDGGPIAIYVAIDIFATTALLIIMRTIMQNRMNEAFEAMSKAQRNEQIAQASKARFLAAASHDLEQPLQSARLFFDQLMRSPDNSARDFAARRVGWSFEVMQDMVTQITQFLQLEANAVAVKAETIVVGPLLARAVEASEHRAGPSGIELRTLPIGLRVIGDRTLIERTLSNFLVNALRHAKPKRVLLGARQQGDRVQLWVIDDGIGVPTADRVRIFEDYSQGSDHGEEVRGGFGLGLGSAKRMAELMGGRVGIDQRWTHGSAFFLELKAA
jgi:signal transduction histidine kinase